MSVVSPASFFAWLDVVRAMYAKRLTSPEEETPGDREKFNNLFTLLMADLFGPKPTIVNERTRTQIIAQLNLFDSELFKTFIDNKLSSLENKSTRPVRPIGPQ